jgi:hypothetical protein
MSVSIPVMIMSLEVHKYELPHEQDMRYGLPSPRLKPSSMYMQRAKADETREYLSCNLYEHLQGESGRGYEQVPFMRTKGG